MAEMSVAEVVARLKERIEGCDRALTFWSTCRPDEDLQVVIYETTKDREAYVAAIALLQQEEQKDGFTLTKEQTAEVVGTIASGIELMRKAVKHGSYTFTAEQVDPAATMRMENLVAKMRRSLGQ